MDALHPAIAAALAKKLTVTVGPPVNLPPPGRGAYAPGSPAPPAADCTEAEFTRAVIGYARSRGWLVHHQRPGRTAKGWRSSITGDPGLPDLVMVRGEVFLLPELKTATGRVRPEQRRWLDALTAAGVLAQVWRPADWDYIVLRLS